MIDFIYLLYVSILAINSILLIFCTLCTKKDRSQRNGLLLAECDFC